MAETSATVNFDTRAPSEGESFAGSDFFSGVTGQAAIGVETVSEFLGESGFFFYSGLLVVVLISIAIWRKLTKGV